MALLSDIVANPKVTKAFIEQKRIANPKINSRRYKLVAYRYDSLGRINRSKQPETFSNLSKAVANAKRIELRESGCYRVDMIETISKVSGRTLTFDGNHNVPAKVNPLPTPNAEPIANAVIAMPWDNPSVDNTPYAILPDVSNRRMDLRKEHEKAERIRSRMGKEIETRNANVKGVKIYRKSTSTLVFSGTEDEACFFLLNSKTFDIHDSIIYLNGQPVD